MAILSYQNPGVGTHMIQGLIGEAIAAAKTLCIRVLSANPARMLYEREGFMERHA